MCRKRRTVGRSGTMREENGEGEERRRMGKGEGKDKENGVEKEEIKGKVRKKWGRSRKGKEKGGRRIERKKTNGRREE